MVQISFLSSQTELALRNETREKELATSEARLATVKSNIDHHASLISSLSAVVERLTDSIIRAYDDLNLCRRQGIALDKHGNIIARLTSKISIVQRLILDTMITYYDNDDQISTHDIQVRELEENLALLQSDYDDLNKGLKIAHQDMSVTKQHLINATDALRRADMEKKSLLDLLKTLTGSAKELCTFANEKIGDRQQSIQLFPDCESFKSLAFNESDSGDCGTMHSNSSASKHDPRLVLQRQIAVHENLLMQSFVVRMDQLTQDIHASQLRATTLENRLQFLREGAAATSEAFAAQWSKDEIVKIAAQTGDGAHDGSEVSCSLPDQDLAVSADLGEDTSNSININSRKQLPSTPTIHDWNQSLAGIPDETYMVRTRNELLDIHAYVTEELQSLRSTLDGVLLEHEIRPTTSPPATGSFSISDMFQGISAQILTFKDNLDKYRQRVHLLEQLHNGPTAIQAVSKREMRDACLLSERSKGADISCLEELTPVSAYNEYNSHSRPFQGRKD